MFIALALRGYSPLTVACSRTVLGALALLAVLRMRGQSLPRGWAIWRFAIPIGFLSTAFPFFLYSWAQTQVPSAFAGLTLAVVPLFVLPLAHFFSDEPMTRRKAFGFFIGFCGVLVLLAPSALEGDFAPFHRLACVIAALSYAVSSVLTRRCPRTDPISLAAASLLTGTAVLLPVTLWFEGVPHWAGPTSGFAILFLGLVATALAVSLRVMVIRSAGSGFLTLVNYQVPLWSMAFGAFILGEALPPTFLLGLVLVLGGLTVSNIKKRRKPN